MLKKYHAQGRLYTGVSPWRSTLGLYAMMLATVLATNTIAVAVYEVAPTYTPLASFASATDSAAVADSLFTRYSVHTINVLEHEDTGAPARVSTMPISIGGIDLTTGVGVQNAARDFVNDNDDLFGLDATGVAGEWVTRGSHFVSWRAEQEISGLPVRGTKVFVSFARDSADIVAWGSNVLSQTSATTTPSILEETAKAAVRSHLDFGAPNDTILTTTLVLQAHANLGSPGCLLAFECEAVSSSAGAWTVLVDAVTGSILRSTGLAATGVVRGTVQLDSYPDEEPNPCEALGGLVTNAAAGLVVSVADTILVSTNDLGQFDVDMGDAGGPVNVQILPQGDPSLQPFDNLVVEGLTPNVLGSYQIQTGTDLTYSLSDTSLVGGAASNTVMNVLDWVYESYRQVREAVPEYVTEELLDRFTLEVSDDSALCDRPQGFYSVDDSRTPPPRDPILLVCTTQSALGESFGDYGEGVAHEYGHALQGSFGNLGGATRNGCLVEGLADVFAVIATDQPNIRMALDSCSMVRRRAVPEILDSPVLYDAATNQNVCPGNRSAHSIGQPILQFYWNLWKGYPGSSLSPAFDGLEDYFPGTARRRVMQIYLLANELPWETVPEYMDNVVLAMDQVMDGGLLGPDPDFEILQRAAPIQNLPLPPIVLPTPMYADNTAASGLQDALNDPAAVTTFRGGVWGWTTVFGYEATTGRVFVKSASNLNSVERTLQYLGAFNVAIPTRTRAIARGDMNHDGETELFFARDGDGVLLTIEEDPTIYPDLRFVDVSASYGIATLGRDATCAAWGDIDLDGTQELYVTRADVSGDVTTGSIAGNGLGDRLLGLNEAHTGFEDITIAAGLDTTASETGVATFVDINRDGPQDLFVGLLGDFDPLVPSVSSRMYVNDGSGAFNNVAGAAAGGERFPLLGNVYDVEWRDVNYDGFLDVILARDASGPGPQSNLMICLNAGASAPGDVTVELNPSPVSHTPMKGVLVADLDLSGSLDVVGLPVSPALAPEAYIANGIFGEPGSTLTPGDTFAAFGLSGASGLYGVVLDRRRGPDIIALGPQGRVLTNESPTGSEVFAGRSNVYTMRLFGRGYSPQNREMGSGAQVVFHFPDRTAPEYSYVHQLGAQGRLATEHDIFSVTTGQYTSADADIIWPDGYVQAEDNLSLVPAGSGDGIVTIQSTFEDAHSPEIVPGTFDVSRVVDAQGDESWVAEWETEYWADATALSIDIEYVAGSGGCDPNSGTVTVRASDADVESEVTRLPSGRWQNALRWVDRPCSFGCTYRAKNPSSANLRQSTTSPEQETFKQKYCVTQ